MASQTHFRARRQKKPQIRGRSEADQRQISAFSREMTVGVREPFKARQRVADAIKERQPILCRHPQQLSELGPIMSLCVRSGLSKTSQILPEHVRTSCSIIGSASSSLNHKTSGNNTFSVRKKSSRVKKHIWDGCLFAHWFVLSLVVLIFRFFT